MSVEAPPSRVRSSDLRPIFHELAADTVTWRVHKEGRLDVFNPRPQPEPFGGGRFDGNHAFPYPFTYLGVERETALTEKLLRNLKYRPDGTRIVPRLEARRHKLVAVRTTRKVRLLDLTTSEALSGIFADEWLIHSGMPEYPKTRAWAHWLREQLPAAEGFIWPSKRNIGGRAIILFGDRCQGAVEFDRAEAELKLYDEPGTKQINELLRRYRASIAPPAPKRPS